MSDIKSLKALVAADRMTATIQGEVDGCISVQEADSMVRDALALAGVEHGIVGELVKLAAEKLVNDRHLAPMVVAMATSPVFAATAGFEFSNPIYAERDLPSFLLKRPEQGIFYYQLLTQVPQPLLVKPGDVVGLYRDATHAQPGQNVFGEAVIPPSEALRKRIQRLGRGLRRRGNGVEVIATMQGIIVQRDDGCYVLPVNVNGAFTIEVASDRLSAMVHLHASGPGGRNPRLEEIVAAAKSMHLQTDADLSSLAAALEALPTESGASIRNCRIATGRPAAPGKDGWVEHLVNLSFNAMPQVGDDGRADYYRLHLFENVVKGQHIARIHPPERGAPGLDVYGRSVEGVAGKAVQVRIGKNVEQSSHDPRLLLAAKDGHVYVKGDKIEIEEVLRIRGDVDFHTGNIRFIGDVVVDGEVRSGFEVRADGNIRIAGVVEDAIVESRKNVIVHSGFLGQGKGIIRAGNDAVVAFVRNQTITARHNILIAGEAIDARLVAGNGVMMESAKSMIVGGEITATRCVCVHTLGNPAGGVTRVRAGIDPVAETRLRRIAEEIEKTTAECEAISRSLSELSAREAGGGLTRSQGMAHAKMTVAAQALQRKLSLLEEEKNKLQRELYVFGSQIRVRGTVFPNVVITLGTRIHSVRDELKRCCFYVANDAIVCESLKVEQTGSGAKRY